MESALIRKLEFGAIFSDGDREKLRALTHEIHDVKAHQDIISENAIPTNVHVIIDGLACRYKHLENGRRAIMALLIPGDFCDLHVAILGAMDHSISTLSPCKVAYIPRETVDDITKNFAAITRAFWWATLVDEATLREWLLNVAQRPAEKRMAHLFAELLLRMQTCGRAEGLSYPFPLTQIELADTLGISAVHTNRILQQLREQKLIEFDGKVVTVRSQENLNHFAEFDRSYLHLIRKTGVRNME